MIRVSRINQEKFLLNCDLIEHVDESPHTIVYMSSGKKYIVNESADEIKRLVLEYKREIFHGNAPLAVLDKAAETSALPPEAPEPQEEINAQEQP